MIGYEMISYTDCFVFRDSYGSWKIRCKRRRRVRILMPRSPSVSRRRPRRIFAAAPAAVGAKVAPSGMAQDAAPQTDAQIPRGWDGGFGRLEGHPRAATIGMRLNARIARSARIAGVRAEGCVGGNEAMTPMSRPHNRLAPRMKPLSTRAPGITAAAKTERPTPRMNAAATAPNQMRICRVSQGSCSFHENEYFRRRASIRAAPSVPL